MAAACGALEGELVPRTQAGLVTSVAAALAPYKEAAHCQAAHGAHGLGRPVLRRRRAAAAHTDRGGPLVEATDLLVLAPADDVVGESKELKPMQLVRVRARPHLHGLRRPASLRTVRLPAASALAASALGSGGSGRGGWRLELWERGAKRAAERGTCDGVAALAVVDEQCLHHRGKACDEHLTNKVVRGER